MKSKKSNSRFVLPVITVLAAVTFGSWYHFSTFTLSPDAATFLFRSSLPLPSGIVVNGDLDFPSSYRSVDKDQWVPSFNLGLKVLKVSGDVTTGHVVISAWPKDFHIRGNLNIQQSKLNLASSDKLVIDGELYGDKATIAEWPQQLSVAGSIHLSQATLANFPDDFHVGKDFILEAARLDTLPKDLEVNGYLNLVRARTHALPENLTVNGPFNMNYSTVSAVPASTRAMGSIGLCGTKITSLPKNFKVGGGACLGETKLTHWPEGFQFNGFLDLSELNWTHWPAHLTVNGTLYLKSSPLTHLPSGWTAKSLNLRYSKITELPANLHLETLDLYGTTQLKTIPASTVITDELDISHSAITSLPEGLTVATLNASDVNIRLPKRLTITHELWVGDGVKGFSAGTVLPAEKHFIGDHDFSVLPPNLLVKGNIDLFQWRTTTVSSGTVVEGDMMLYNKKVSLPSDLVVGGTLHLSSSFRDGTAEQTLPEGLVLNGLDVKGSDMKALPNNLIVTHLTGLSKSAITRLGEGTRINGDVSFSGSHIKHWPSRLVIHGNASFDDTVFESLPKTLIVTGNASFYHTKVTHMSTYWQIGGDVDVRNSLLGHLPVHLQIGGNFIAHPQDKLVPNKHQVSGKIMIKNQK